mgnify:CR=1 FL=1
MSLWDIIVWPFARLLEILYNWTDSYGLAIIPVSYTHLTLPTT